ncbi:MAG: ABC transporter permease [Bifidobacteriaceae bacterium]|jgi:peptide/nickel transport system permease protein|nr:ABC transporter permease [Bifidobacteriaceae bacterium]
MSAIAQAPGPAGQTGQPKQPAKATGAQRSAGTTVRVIRQLLRQPAAVFGLAIVLIVILVAIFAPLLTPYEPSSIEWGNQITPKSVPGPSAEHLLGLDSFGSDLMTQIVYGARQTIVVGVVSTGIGVSVGALLGLIAGGIGGWVDTAIMRLMDIMLSIPALLLAVSIVSLMGRSPMAVMVAIGVSQVPIFTRLLRGSLLGERRRDYVLAARSLGLRRPGIVTMEMMPNAAGPLIVQATLMLATAVNSVAALSFLGLSTSEPTAAEWGLMLVKAQSRLVSSPLLAFAPGCAIAITALGFTLLGEALREQLDPKSRPR